MNKNKENESLEQPNLLKDDSKLLQLIVEKLPGHVYWLDVEGRYLGCNERQARAFGVSRKDVIGKRNIDFLSPQDAKALDKINQYVMSSIPNGKEYDSDEFVERGEYEEHYRSTKSPLYDENGKLLGILGVSLDVTDKKRAEQLEMASKIQDEELANNAEVLKIIHKAGHDLMSPLLVFRNVLLNCTELSDKHRSTLSAIERDIRAIADVLNQKFRAETELNYSKTPQSLLVYLAIQELIDRKRQEYNDLKIDFIAELNPNTMYSSIKIDPVNFSRAMSNIINNSVEAMKNSVGRVLIKLYRRAENVVIAISDNGIGMPIQIANKIRERSRVVSTKQNGSGLGLSHVYYVLQKYDGRLRLYTEEGVGTEFLVEFPEQGKPDYIASSLHLKEHDVVLILDDVPSVFDSWERLFHPFLDKIEVKYFTQYDNVLEFIANFKDKERLVLISDFYLQPHSKNGLTVVLESGIKTRSLLTTNCYDDKKIFECADEAGVKVIPKQFVESLKVKFDQR